ncbi:MAG: GTPase HflX [Lachnospiraceae bacterium]
MDLERILLVGVSLDNEEDTIESLAELAELTKTAGGEVVREVYQNREQIHPGTYVGKGKLEEIRDIIEEDDIDAVVCDDELSPAQLRNLNEYLDIKVLDRTIMILDIFAMRARTSEGKIQVELAQLKYRSSRLVGLRSSLSRLGGGIGTRGPGEKKLEMDRRIIRERIAALNRELEGIKKSRAVARKKRLESKLPLACIVGYTNAGKSTLLNELTDAEVLSEDKLFATLDPTTRVYEYEDGQEILLTDTVGFINKLPHHLVDAFRSTLEEAKYADIIIHVVDISNPNYSHHMDVVYDTLKLLDVKDKPVITVYNKVDKLTDDVIGGNDARSDVTLRISAKNHEGLDTLLSEIQNILNKRMVYIEKVVPYSEAGKIQNIRNRGQLLHEEYTEEGIYVKAMIPKDIYIL